MWGTTKIAKTCLRTRMRDPRRNPHKPFLYVDISAIDRGLKVITSAPEIIGADAPSRARKEICEGDILVSTVRPNLNAVAVVPPDLDGQIASTGFCVLRPNRAAILGKYLFYFTTTPHFIGVVSSKVRGAHYPAVSDGDVKDIELPLPTIFEQRRIIEILDQAEALRRKRAEADAKAARIIPALFHRTFGDTATNPKGWSTVPIGELVERIDRRNPSDKMDSTFQYVDIAGVDGTSGRIAEYKELTGREAPSRARQVIRTNDVLVSTVRPYLRATALVPPELDHEICSTGFCVLRAQGGKGYGYLYALSRLPWFTESLNSMARGASYPAVTDNDVLGLRVPYLIGNHEIEGLDVSILQLIEMQNQRVASVKALEGLFSTLLHYAFTGDLTAKWREAHMQELLAEMERQAKALEDKI